jgi:hypothetical protein
MLALHALRHCQVDALNTNANWHIIGEDILFVLLYEYWCSNSAEGTGTVEDT